jgi:cohesin complex subunit SA-1/2
MLITCIAEVYTSGDSLKDVASQWLTRHEENGPLAVTELINFLLKSAGCNIEVNEDHINDPENVDGKLEDIQTEYQAVSYIH